MPDTVTALDLVTRAARTCNVLAAGETLGADEMEIVYWTSYTIDGHAFDGPVQTLPCTQTVLGPNWGDAEVRAFVGAAKG